jgi:hypothetical protein
LESQEFYDKDCVSIGGFFEISCQICTNKITNFILSVKDTTILKTIKKGKIVNDDMDKIINKFLLRPEKELKMLVVQILKIMNDINIEITRGDTIHYSDVEYLMADRRVYLIYRTSYLNGRGVKTTNTAMSFLTNRSDHIGGKFYQLFFCFQKLIPEMRNVLTIDEITHGLEIVLRNIRNPQNGGKKRSSRKKHSSRKKRSSRKKHSSRKKRCSRRRKY